MQIQSVKTAYSLKMPSQSTLYLNQISCTACTNASARLSWNGRTYRFNSCRFVILDTDISLFVLLISDGTVSVSCFGDDRVLLCRSIEFLLLSTTPTFWEPRQKFLTDTICKYMSQSQDKRLGVLLGHECYIPVSTSCKYDLLKDPYYVIKVAANDS